MNFELPEGYDMGYDIVMAPISWIIENTTGSIDFGEIDTDPVYWWNYMIRKKAGDTGFGHLVESIMEHGFVEGSSVGWEDGIITEGHHRLVAAILLGLDEVPVSAYGSDCDYDEISQEAICAHWNYGDPHSIYLETAVAV